jgi:hypothetical protein
LDRSNASSGDTHFKLKGQIMRPQRKPFVVEIKKTKQFVRKPASTETGRVDVVLHAGTKTTASTIIRGGGRS